MKTYVEKKNAIKRTKTVMKDYGKVMAKTGLKATHFIFWANYAYREVQAIAWEFGCETCKYFEDKLEGVESNR